MKRGGPKANPEKVREFQRRGRKRAAENARLKPREPFGRVIGRVYRNGVLIGTVADEPPKAVRFQPRHRGFPLVRSQACAVCGGQAASWHHWLPQEKLRVAVRSLRLGEERGRAMLRRVIHDGRNISPLCERCHPMHGFVGDLTAEQVPGSAHEFAAELGPEWAESLRRMYPAAGSSGGATDGGH